MVDDQLPAVVALVIDAGSCTDLIVSHDVKTARRCTPLFPDVGFARFSQLNSSVRVDCARQAYTMDLEAWRQNSITGKMELPLVINYPWIVSHRTLVPLIS